MPIKGLTDQPRQFSEIGQLRKGAPKPKDKQQPGKDLTYFRATFEDSEEKAADMFHQAYGSEPREVNIRLPFNTVDENFDAWQEAYVKGGLIHRCNGEYTQYEVDPQTGSILVMNGLDVDGNKVKCDGSADCRPTGRLKVIVPELRRLAFMTALTTSVWDILNISRQLEAIRYVNDGKLQNVPLILKRRPREISTPSGTGGKRARREMWLLSIEADPDWVATQILALSAPDEAEPLALPPGMRDITDDEEIVGENLPFTDEEPKAENLHGISEGEPTTQERWNGFLESANITQEKALEFLGAESVNEWKKREEGRNLDAAIQAIQESLAWQKFLADSDFTEAVAENILGVTVEEWRRLNPGQSAIDEVVAVGGLTKPE